MSSACGDRLKVEMINCLKAMVLLVWFAVFAGCGGPYEEPTIDEFNGKLTHQGEDVGFAANEKAVLRLVFHKNGQRFGIPINQDGTFDIGWMPIGEYSAILEKTASSKGAKGSTGRQLYNIQEGMTITKGQTRYIVELGKDFKQ